MGPGPAGWEENKEEEGCSPSQTFLQGHSSEKEDYRLFKKKNRKGLPRIHIRAERELEKVKKSHRLLSKKLMRHKLFGILVD